MVKILYSDIVDGFSDEHKNFIMSIISDEQKKKVNRFIYDNDKRRCLMGLALTGFVYSELPGRLKIKVNDYGKPYIENSDICYNISHSGRYVIIAYGNSNVGADIEKIGKCHNEIASFCFSEEEYAMLNQYEDDKKIYFYKLWTLKESYIKYDGRGLYLPMKSFSVCSKENQFYVKNQIVKFKQFKVEKKYMISVCSKEKITDKLNFISISDICLRLKEISEKYAN